MPRVPFSVQSYRHRSLPVAAQRLINWFAEAEPRDAKAPVVLLPTAGVLTFATLPDGPVRGMHVMNADLYVVAGATMFRVDVDAMVTTLGTIDGALPVSMADNGTQVIIVAPDERTGWVATASTLVRITDPDFLPCVAVDVIDGYAIFAKADSTEFFLSAIGDALSYDALDFASAEGSPDNLVSLKRVGRELWLFGERTTEIWSNVGGSDFPFLRVSGAFVEKGCASSASVATGAGTVFWLGDDRVIYVADGFKPTRISTHAIEQALAGYSVVNDARGWFYEQEGHQFYVLSFPTDGATWVYDLATRMWHERESEGYITWRCVAGTAYAGGIIAGDARDGRLYRVDTVLYDEAGESVRRSATGTAFHSEGKRLFFSRLEADMETGTGLTTGQGITPKVWLQFSDNGGRTFSNEFFAELGAQGAYRTRAQWRRLGAGRDRVFRISMSDPVRTAIIAANIDVEQAAH